MNDAILGDLLSDARAVVARLLEEPLRTRESLAALLAEATARHGAARGREQIQADLALADRLATRCAAMLARWDTFDAHGRKLVQVAVRYFALEEDGASDLDSVFGFDDDAEVVDAVGRALGFGALEP